MSSLLIKCGGPMLPPAFPDEGCCESSAMSGGRDCSCWLEVYSSTPTAEIQAGPQRVRSLMCRDCAYRPDSPERAELAGDRLDASLTRPFTCHQGMPVLRGYINPDSRVTFCLWAPGLHDRDNFAPITVSDRAWLSDGQPAELCAGWAAASGARHG